MRVNMSDVKAFILKQKNTEYEVNSFLCGSTSVWSAGLQPTPDSYFTFTLLDDDTYSIAAANASNMPETVIFPSTYNGKAVTKIADKGFTDTSMQNLNGTTKTLVIPEGITTIGEFAFGGCIALKYVTLPSTLTTIGQSGFAGCVGIDEIFIPANVTEISSNAFNSTNKNTVIYCEAESKPDGWAASWNGSNHTVVWGYKPTDDSYFTFTEQEDGT